MQNGRTHYANILIVVMALLLNSVSGLTGYINAVAQLPAEDALERGFKNPPDEAEPRVWWHWMNGNVTKEGITADLEWMKRVGIGGVQMFDANIGNILAGEFGVRQYVDKRIVFHTPEWKEMLRFAASECDRLGLEMTMHSSGGWSETGGPWVKPEQAMKKLVWSETRVEGGRKFSGKLAAPPSVNGPFQNLPRTSPFGPPQQGPPDPTYYADTAVIVLVLPDHIDRLTLPTLRKIRELVAAGATVVGPKPKRSPSLSGYPASDDELRALANEVWGATDGRTVLEHAFGKGKVYWNRPLPEVLDALKTPPDFEFSRPRVDTSIEYIHRQTGDTDIYFVTNQMDRVEDVTVRLRVNGKAAELWHPETAEIAPASYTIENGLTTVPLQLGPHESLFLVFRQKASSPSRVLPRPVSTAVATIQGPWEVSFPPNQGAPASIKLNSLTSWTAHAEDGVKYFSGTAVYTKEIDAAQDWFRHDAKLVLDLGRVKEVAEVSVNGKSLGILWRPPFQVDVAGALKSGTNKLEIRITNLWQNRMIGDEHLPPEKRYTFAYFRPYKKDSPLLESGLLGPVTLSTVALK